MKKRMKLRAEVRRIALFADAPYKEVGLDLLPQHLIAEISTIRKAPAKRVDGVAHGRGLGKDSLQELNNAVFSQEPGHAAGQRPSLRSLLAGQPFRQCQDRVLVSGIEMFDLGGVEGRRGGRRIGECSG